MTAHRIRRTNDEWKTIILNCRISGESDYQWCRQNGISLSCFYRHVRLLRKEACAVPEQTAVQPVHQEVVPIHLDPDTKFSIKETYSSLDLKSASDFVAAARIISSGLTVELSNQATPAVIQAVIQSLQAQC